MDKNESWKYMIHGTPLVENPNRMYVLPVVNTEPKEYKITLKNTWLHFKKICIHKYWVAKYCFKAGFYWQGLTHDLSKFSLVEFWESVKYYQGTSSPINAAKDNQGYSLAWQHHKGRNPHHYEYWTDKYDDGTIALEMPYKYAVELLCDWLGAARAYTGNRGGDFYQKELKWWIDKRDNKHPKMNQQTLNFVDIVFNCLANREQKGWDTDFVFKSKGLLEYYFKLAKTGNYEHWKNVEDRLREDAKKKNESELLKDLNIKVHTVPIFF